MILETIDLNKRFGGVTAVVDFSLKLPPGAIFGIIGPNGAGKTTIFNLISGIYRPDSGKIIFQGSDITGLEQHQIARKGIGRTFQNIRLFRGLTVLENVLVALDPGAPYGLGESLLSTPRKFKIEKSLRERARHYLNIVGLDKFRDLAPESLPYGLRRKLEIARALATEPQVLLLDEPAAGLNPSEVRELISLISDLNGNQALSILLIEHRMEVVMQLCQCIYVQNFGRTLAIGPPAEIQRHPEVIKAYLGEEE
ncbi:MAG: ABC transporter ATP-binding protein [Thermanaeromonas sp.]|uniref:ABC transporter ATP-binding protein n=1 Tax=Thermanaeromonas sp. TaxID=2003697 RepID=UPI00243A8577|nr:ABC transporter ATP-binding protein [Thermanaeromonas sp.]MCG0278372.1 ABC transporter ATP-binding protein [Thermanaeromonas sp.]